MIVWCDGVVLALSSRCFVDSIERGGLGVSLARRQMTSGASPFRAPKKEAAGAEGHDDDDKADAADAFNIILRAAIEHRRPPVRCRVAQMRQLFVDRLDVVLLSSFWRTQIDSRLVPTKLEGPCRL